MTRPGATARAVLLVLSVVWLHEASPACAARGQTLLLNLGVASEYDDNLLQYSDAQRDLFLGGTRPERFSLHSLDDLTWGPAAALQWSLDQGRGRRHLLRARFTGDFHTKNATADYHALSAAWRESFHGSRRFTAGAYWLPRYYLRQLIAEDYVPPFPGLTRYRRAEFGLTIGSASWSQPVAKGAEAELAYQLEGRHYTSDFRERDSKTHQGELTLGLLRATRGVNLDLMGGYRVARAKAEDGDEPEAVPDADISYHGPLAGIGGRWDIVRREAWRWTGEARYEFGYRAYDSNQPTDTYHFGRHDVIHRLEAALRWSIRPHWSVRGSYAFETSTATLGANAPPSSDVGSYRQQNVALGAEWSGVLWRARGESDSDASE